MKKYIICIVFGLLLLLPVAVHADDVRLMIGKAVEGSFPLIINEQKSEKDAIVIDGTSYIPIRAAGELFGYDVSFVDSQVILKKKERDAIEMDQATKEKLDKWEQDRQAAQKEKEEFDQKIKAEEDRAAKIRAEGDAEEERIKEELKRNAQESAQLIQQ